MFQGNQVNLDTRQVFLISGTFTSLRQLKTTMQLENGQLLIYVNAKLEKYPHSDIQYF
jgi:hypothetical protein